MLLKRALIGIGSTPSFDNLTRFLLAAARSPWVYLSLSVQVLGYVLWMILISRVKLGVATASVGSGFYIAMALAAWAFYGESISYAQWLGIVLITVGVVLVSLQSA
jgi:drug/metabolite transporter (DMT)-like permease